MIAIIKWGEKVELGGKKTHPKAVAVSMVILK